MLIDLCEQASSATVCLIQLLSQSQQAVYRRPLVHSRRYVYVLAVPRASKRERQHRWTPVATFAYTTNAEDNVVFVDGRTCQIVPIDVAHLNDTSPMRLNSLSVQNLIPFWLQSNRTRPSELTEVVAYCRVDANICRLTRCICKTPHRTCYHFGGASVVIEVQKLHKVAVLLAVLDPDILVLLRIVFVRLDEPYTIESGFQERTVITASAVAVEAVDKAYGHLGEGIGCDFVNVTTKVARWTVVVSANAQTGGHNSGVLGQRGTLTEQSDVVWIGGAIFCFRVAYHVEVDHSGNVSGAVLVGLRKVCGTQKALFFACESCKRDRSFGSESRKDAS